jgi:hypothetical protein
MAPFRTVGAAWRFRVSAFWRRARLLLALERALNACTKAQTYTARWFLMVRLKQGFTTRETGFQGLSQQRFCTSDVA